MAAKRWTNGMLGLLLGAVCFSWLSERSFADPPRGHITHRGATVTRHGFYSGNVNRYYIPPQQFPYYGHGYGYNSYSGHVHHLHQPCYPGYGIPRQGYYRPASPGIGVGVGGWPSGPSFGGGAFPYGPSYGSGVNIRIGR